MAQFELGFNEKTTTSIKTTEEFDIEAGTFSAVRVFEGPWENRHDFIHDHIIRDSTGNTPSPQAYPDAPLAKARRARVIGRGKPSVNETTGMAQWERAEITVTYETLPHNTDDNPSPIDAFTNSIFIEEEIDSNVDIVRVETEDVVTSTGSLIEEGGPLNIILPTATIILTQTHLLFAQWGAIGRQLGKVNRDAFITPSGFVCPPQTLMYQGPVGDTKVNINTGGGQVGDEDFPVPVWRLSHRFDFKRTGWNKKLVNGEWVNITFEDTGDPPYELGDLYNIFLGEAGDQFDPTLINSLANDLDSLDLLIAGGTPISAPAVQAILQSINTTLIALGFRVPPFGS